MIRNWAFLLLFIGSILPLYSQTPDTTALSNQQLDEKYIQDIEKRKQPPKVLHAEPLYIDLIRDLGARKGEKEWNLGMGITDNLSYDVYEMLVEYEWAPIDRLGLEIEVPFSIIAANGKGYNGERKPSSSMESLKTALQWSFLVSEKHSTSLALGYINELEFSDFGSFGNPLFKGNVYNPFFVAAKRWGNNFHTLIYTGPAIEQSFRSNGWESRYELHSNIHYMITGTRNFVGIEVNKEFHKHDFDMTIRPQMRLEINKHFMLGIVGGIPVYRENQRFSMFTRLIWEPGH
jgi:hypothetical protein